MAVLSPSSVRKGIAGLLIGIGAAALVLGVDLVLRTLTGGAALTPFDLLELKTYDWRLKRTARPETARRDIALVEIDEHSLQLLQPFTGRWPWPRVVHSSVIDFLARAPAKAIVYDVLFADPDKTSGFQYGGSSWSGEESDREFARSVKKAGNVIALVDATFDGEVPGAPPVADAGYRIDGPGIHEPRALLPPFPALARSASGFGHNLFVLDEDGPLRHVVPFVRRSGRALPSLGLAAAIRSLGIAPSDVALDGTTLRLGDRVMPLAWHRVRSDAGVLGYLWAPIDFRGPALGADLRTRTYPTYPVFDLLQSEEQLEGGQKPTVDPAVFRDKIVFVGVTASGLFDAFETPFSNGKMSGIQIHAAAADDVLSNRFMRAAGSGAFVSAIVAAGLAAGLISALVPAWWATGATLLLVMLIVWMDTRLFANGYWLNLTQPVLAASGALFGGVAYQYFVEGREKRKMKQLFGRYVSKDVYEQLVADPSLARLGGQRRDMTVLFSDIRGFTTVSERGQPEEIVGMLNEYFTRMVDIVFRHRGTVDKFVGDMVMALFGAPLDDPRHADHAVEAALDMIDALGELNARWKAEGRPQLDIGIGINTGPMIAGNIGSEAIMSYTVIGDAVNLGSRLESLNKEYRTRIIISDAVRSRLTQPFNCRALGDVVVKGKTEPVAIFEVVGRA